MIPKTVVKWVIFFLVEKFILFHGNMQVQIF